MTTGSNNTCVYAGAETSGIYRLPPGSDQWEELTNLAGSRWKTSSLELSAWLAKRV